MTEAAILGSCAPRMPAMPARFAGALAGSRFNPVVNQAVNQAGNPAVPGQAAVAGAQNVAARAATTVDKPQN